MTFKEFALDMYPCWIAGIVMIAAVLAAGKKYLLRIQKESLWSFVKFMCWVTALRLILHKIFPENANHFRGSDIMPWGVPFTVFWEDAIHGLPLLILREWIKDKKYLKYLYYPVLFLFMFEFALGHLYQGLGGLFLGLYIPYSINMGKKHGFGTVMICHMLYDLCTMVFIRCLLKL